MSANANAIPLTVTVACPPAGPFVPGIQYRMNGLVQGTLGTYDIITVALSTTELDTNVTVITAPGNIWRGRFDFATCELTKVEDEYDNVINGSSNISLFPWFNGVSVNGNKIEDISGLIPSAGMILQNVTISGASSVDLSAASGTVVLDSVAVQGGSSITWAGSNDLTISSSLFNATFLSSNNAGNVTFNAVLANNSTLNLNQAANVSFQGDILSSSTVNLTATLTGVGTLNVNNSLITGTSTLANAAADIPGTTTYTAVTLQRGTLNVNNFNGTNIELLNSSTTLIANTSNATKTGYVNALP